MATLVVSNASDVVNGDTTSIAALVADSGSDGISVREAILASNNTVGEDVVEFDASLSGATISLGGTALEITESLSIDGSDLSQRVVIDAGSQSRVLNFSLQDKDATLTINSLEITGGKTTADNQPGGGVFFAGGQMFVVNSLIHGNATDGSRSYGGGVAATNTFSDQPQINLIGSTVTNNSTTGFEAFGGGIYSNDEEVYIEDSEISNNTTSGFESHGGGLQVDRVLIVDSTINGNIVTGYGARGGGVSGGDIRLTNSFVTNNRTENYRGFGGGIGAGRATLVNSVIRDNSTLGVGPSPQQTGNAWGGGIFAGEVILHDSVVESNHTEGAVSSGGGIFATEVQSLNSRIEGNHTSGDNSHGGGIYVPTNNILARLRIENSLVRNNRTEGASSDGGGLYSRATDQLLLSNSTVAENQTLGADSDGGGIRLEFANLELVNSTIVFNDASGQGGGISTRNADLNAFNSIIANNSTGSGIGPDLARIETSPQFVFVEHSLISNATSSGITSTPGDGNLLNVDPMLGPLADNGGDLHSYSPLPGSPVINAGDDSMLPLDFSDLDGDSNIIERVPVDQRGVGFPRFVSQVDMGSIEFNAVPELDLNGSSSSTTTGYDTKLFVTDTVGVNLVAPDAQIIDDGNLQSMSIAVDSVPDGADEVLTVVGVEVDLSQSSVQVVVVDGRGFTLDYEATTQRLTILPVLPSGWEPEFFESLLRSITYDNLSEDATEGVRTFSIEIGDGGQNVTSTSLIDVVTGTVRISSGAGGLVVSDVTGGDVGSDSEFTVSIVSGSLQLVSNEEFQSAPIGASLSADKMTLETPLSSTNGLTIQTGAGSDSVTIDYSNGLVSLPIVVKGQNPNTGEGGDDEVSFIGTGITSGVLAYGRNTNSATLTASEAGVSVEISHQETQPLVTQGLASLTIASDLNVGDEDVTIDSNASTTLGETTTVGGGTLIANGGLEVPNSGTLQGEGTIDTGENDFVNRGEVRSTGSGFRFRSRLRGRGSFWGRFRFFRFTSFGFSPAAVEIFGDATFEPTNTHEVELGGLVPDAQHDQVNATGTLTLGGTLDVQLIDNFVPANGDSFDIMTAATFVGRFGEVVFPSLPGGLEMVVHYDTNVVRLEIVQPFVAVVDSSGDAGDSNLNDGVCNDGSGACTLRAAIQQANLTANVGIPDRIEFDLPLGSQVITPISPLPSITDALVVDATTQPGYLDSPLVDLKGELAGSNADGIDLSASGSTIRGIAISGFSGDGIAVSGSSNILIQDNVIGIDSTGFVDGNRFGLRMSTAEANVIDGNTISGNNASGVLIDEKSRENEFTQNQVGLDFTGQFAVGNKGAGVLLRGPNNVIGKPGQGNTISGNGASGIVLNVSGSDSTIQGNKIGVGVSGSTAVPNRSFGILIQSGRNVIGGNSTDGTGNQVSGNGRQGIVINGADATQNAIKGNLVGTDADGTSAVGNNSYGIYIIGASDNTIGGAPGADEGNVFSGNGASGMALAGADNNQVLDNQFGTSIDGSSAVANSATGVFLFAGSSDNEIISNQIAGNLASGLVISGPATENNVVENNLIGVNAAGTTTLSNGSFAVLLQAPNNLLGGSVVKGNLIAGSTRGVVLSGPSAFGNTVAGNFIGTNIAGDDLGMPTGVQFAKNAANNTIGPDNVIGFNATGIRLLGSSGSENRVTANSFTNNSIVAIDLANPGPTVNDLGDADEGANRTLNHPEIQSAEVVGSDLAVSFSVPAEPANASYPLTIEFYKSDPSGQGEVFLGTSSYQTVDFSAGVVTKTLVGAAAAFGLASGDFISATAIDQDGNTSEFSAAAFAGSPPVALAIASGGARSSLDVSGDGFITPFDAVLGINALSTQARGGQGEASLIFRADTSGDGNLTPYDILQVLNFLNSQSRFDIYREAQSFVQRVDEIMSTAFERDDEQSDLGLLF